MLKDILAGVAIGSFLAALGAYMFYPAMYVGQPYAYLGQLMILQWATIGVVALVAMGGKFVLERRSYSGF